MKNCCVKLCLSLFIGILALITANAAARARTITDMLGREVELPDKITRVYSASPPGYALVYSLAPELLCGRAMRIGNDFDEKLLRDDVAALPLIGTFGGQGNLSINTELLMAAKPDLMIEVVMADPGDAADALQARSANALELLGIPYIYVCAKDITAYPAAYEFLGEALGREERARELAAYIRGALNDAERVAAQVPAEQRPKVYYAEGLDGLSTESSDTFHAYLLILAGDVNVHKQSLTPVGLGGLEKVSIEQVMAYNPDVILAFEKPFWQSVYKHSGWQSVKAVQNKRVYWIPRGPFNWFDRPPSFMRGLGLKWLLATLYPEHYHIDMEQETHNFYKTFLWADLTPAEIQNLLYGPVPEK